MTPYASRTGTGRNLAIMRALGWRLLVSRAGVWRTEGFRYCLDNGAWSDFLAGTEFDADKFEELLETLGAGADWVVAPDLVAAGTRSLDFSLRWLNRCRSVCPLVLIATQDGMEPADLAPYVGANVGLFHGGSTGWKMAEMIRWGTWAAEREIYFHVARVNTGRRMVTAAASGANSIDGSSGSRFAKNIQRIDDLARQGDIFSPRRLTLDPQTGRPAARVLA